MAIDIMKKKTKEDGDSICLFKGRFGMNFENENESDRLVIPNNQRKTKPIEQMR